MSTELDTINAEIVELPELLTEGRAKVLDKRIRQCGTRLVGEMDNLVELLTEAARGQIHAALGFASWTAYVRDAVTIVPADKDERKSLVLLMAGKGMSQRAIADTIGASQATVSRDQAESDSDESVGETTGLDGRSYQRKPKQEPIDVEFTEEPVKVPPVSKDFRDEMINLKLVVQAFKDVTEDERFPKAIKTIAKNNLNDLQSAIKDLEDLVDTLMGE